jgi:hypothetical protein
VKWAPSAPSVSILGYDQAIPADRARLAYLSVLGQSAQFRWQEAVLMDCDYYVRSHRRVTRQH